MRSLLSLLALLVAVSLAGGARAITWCHDYSLYAATGWDQNRTSVAELRGRLTALGYKRFPFTNAASNPAAQKRLRAGDVVVFGEAHSGAVNARQRIDHFLQPAGTPGTAFAPDRIGSQGNFRRDVSLIDILETRHRMKDHRTGDEWDVLPYRDKPVEVWRRQPSP